MKKLTMLVLGITLCMNLFLGTNDLLHAGERKTELKQAPSRIFDIHDAHDMRGRYEREKIKANTNITTKKDPREKNPSKNSNLETSEP